MNALITQIILHFTRQDEFKDVNSLHFKTSSATRKASSFKSKDGSGLATLLKMHQQIVQLFENNVPPNEQGF